MSQKHGLGDAPIEDKYHRKMNALARTLDEWFNGNARGKDRRVGFCLMVFEFGDSPGRANYISKSYEKAPSPLVGSGSGGKPQYFQRNTTGLSPFCPILPAPAFLVVRRVFVTAFRAAWRGR